MIDQHLLRQYLDRFARLHRAAHPSLGRAPHKPVLLLAILDMVQHGLLNENLIPITPELVAAFRARWRTLVPDGAWQEKLALPFRHLTYDGFWELVRDGAPLAAKALGNSASLLRLSALADGGRLAPDLWALLQDGMALQVLRAHLLAAYFPDRPQAEQPNPPADPLAQEAERLLSEAEARFRPRSPASTGDEDGAFVRHALFPRVVSGLYGQSCAVCRLRVRDDKGGQVVDGAHILPFARFHNDDPRNGIALCKNHHWGFDHGWFSADDERRLVVSPRMVGAEVFVRAGEPLALPSRDQYIPAVEALRWHRANVLLS